MVVIREMEFTEESVGRFRNWVLSHLDRYDDAVRADPDKWIADTFNNKDIMFFEGFDPDKDPEFKDPIGCTYVMRNYLIMVHLLVYKPIAFVKNFLYFIDALRPLVDNKYNGETYFFPVMSYNPSAEPLIRAVCPYFITHEAATLYEGKAAAMRLYVGRLAFRPEEA
jgi:hypothetical protein